MKPTKRLLLCGVACFLFPAIAIAGDCRGLTPPVGPPTGPKRLLQPDDLLRLRDIGPVENGNTRAPVLTVSPDARQVAFQLRQVDAVGTGYCLGVFVLNLSDGRVRQIDLGGDPILTAFSAWGFAENVPNGTITPAAPQWSPDGRWIGYLRRDAGVTQVWVAQPDGRHAKPITQLSADVESFHWTQDGKAVAIESRPGLAAARQAIGKEASTGYLFDERFIPGASSIPLPREPIAAEHDLVDMITGAVTRAPEGVPIAAEPTEALLTVKTERGDVAWTTRSGAALKAPIQLHLRRATGKKASCATANCDGIVDLWMAPEGGTVFFLRREGWRLSGLALYAWSPDRAEPRRILATDDVLLGCQMAKLSLVCAQESSLQPRRLVRIDLRSGRIEPIFDPNPEFAGLALGSVQRFKWTNALGIDTFGDLVLPPDYRPGTPLPLIIVQYESRGFLRGGTGDDYPIQAFAARGYAVLSFQRPIDVAYFKGGGSAADANRMDRIDWADRRSVQSSVEVAIKDLVERGLVDPSKIGITGLSDGASMVQFALVNSHLFKAAAISTCCEESTPINLMDGPAVASTLNKAGYPSLLHEDAAFWRPMSFRSNAKKIKTPILMQLADREYLGALEGYGALKEAGAPVEMFVFPDEYHIKWHPDHRLATYVRVLDWFDFWLKGREDPDPSKQAQYTRWRGLTAGASPIAGDTPGP